MHVITDPLEGARLLEHDSAIALDIETGGLDWQTDSIAVLTLYGDRSRVPVVLHLRGAPIPEPIRHVLTSGNRLIVGHNLVSFDALFLAREGVDIRGQPIFDTLVAEQVCNVQGRRDVSASLKATLQRRVGKKIKKDADHDSWLAPELTESQLQYVIDDVRHLHELRAAQLERARESEQLAAIEFEMRLVPVVIGMTLTGFPVDVVKWSEFGEAAEKKAAEISAQFSGVNLRSPKQVSQMFRELGVELDHTAREDLSLLANYSQDEKIRQLAKDILDARVAFKIVSSYGWSWVEKHVRNGRVHARWWQCGTDTGRFSSSDPNMQQIPREMRGAFGGVDGVEIVALDYSQIEVRVAAALSKDRKMMKLLAGAEDLHGQVASLLFGSNYTQEDRTMAKAIMFTMLFGGSAAGIQRHLATYGVQLSLDEATRIRKRFIMQFPELAEMIRKAQERAKLGRPTFVRMPSGHKRLLVGEKLTAQRLLNSAIQGYAASGIKNAMLRIHELGLSHYLRLQVHDELVFEIPEGEVEELLPVLQQCMREGMEEYISPVNVFVTVKRGKYWS
jgi:DNA polymerase I-like protein with 3'-5' exonuclease and polymerase domains